MGKLKESTMEKCAWCGKWHSTRLAMCPECEKEAKQTIKERELEDDDFIDMEAAEDQLNRMGELI